ERRHARAADGSGRSRSAAARARGSVASRHPPSVVSISQRPGRPPRQRRSSTSQRDGPSHLPPSSNGRRKNERWTPCPPETDALKLSFPRKRESRDTSPVTRPGPPLSRG